MMDKCSQAIVLYSGCRIFSFGKNGRRNVQTHFQTNLKIMNYENNNQFHRHDNLI